MIPQFSCFNKISQTIFRLYEKLYPKCIQPPVLKQPTFNYHQLHLAGCSTSTMPRSFRLFSITHTTNIILVDSNFNMIQGGLRHMDRSTTITNRDAFNIESTVTEQPLPLSTTSLGNQGKVVLGS